MISLCLCFFFTLSSLFLFFFFFNDTATTEIYTLSLHDALPICREEIPYVQIQLHDAAARSEWRSEEHTSELQSPDHLVCRLLLEKKKKKQNTKTPTNKRKQRQQEKTTRKRS